MADGAGDPDAFNRSASGRFALQSRECRTQNVEPGTIKCRDAELARDNSFFQVLRSALSFDFRERLPGLRGIGEWTLHDPVTVVHSDAVGGRKKVSRRARWSVLWMADR
jgi:hypothetical protein